jgi:hypothetical protein
VILFKEIITVYSEDYTKHTDTFFVGRIQSDAVKAGDAIYLPLAALMRALVPNVAVEWLTLLSRIREVPDSNLVLKTGYSD